MTRARSLQQTEELTCGSPWKSTLANASIISTSPTWVTVHSDATAICSSPSRRTLVHPLGHSIHPRGHISAGRPLQPVYGMQGTRSTSTAAASIPGRSTMPKPIRSSLSCCPETIVSPLSPRSISRSRRIHLRPSRHGLHHHRCRRRPLPPRRQGGRP